MEQLRMDGLVEQLRNGSKRAVSVLISAVEEDAEWLDELWPKVRKGGSAENIFRIGITGPPGVGKSTLIGSLATALSAEGKRVAVLAVDPSSRDSGGAVLGDRVRMGKCGSDPNIYIRSLGARGQLGGLTYGIDDIEHILASWGAEILLVESVGVGQSEIDISEYVDLTVVVLQPGAGDDVQLVKAGLMESADLFIVNKADGPSANKLRMQIQASTAFSKRGKREAIKTIATTGEGIKEVLGFIGRRRREESLEQERERRRMIRLRRRLLDAIESLCGRRLLRSNSAETLRILEGLGDRRKTEEQYAVEWLDLQEYK